MADNNGKLSWGACINTTGNRVCDPQGKFNREGAEFEQATHADLVRLEDDRAWANSVLMTVPLDQIIEWCTFNGDFDKIAGYLCQQDVGKEADEIRQDPPELPPRSMRGSCSPVKDGENAEEKLINETIKKNNLKLLTIYETWKKRVKAWIKDAEKVQGSDLSAGKKGGRLRSPCGQEGRPSAQPVGGAGRQH